MLNEEQIPVSANDALISARAAEDAMRQRARSIRPLIATVGLASGAITFTVLLPEPWQFVVGVGAFLAIVTSGWLFRHSGPRRLIAQSGQHVAGRLVLVAVMFMFPIGGILIGTYTDNVWAVVVLARALPAIMLVIPWWWERKLPSTVAGK